MKWFDAGDSQRQNNYLQSSYLSLWKCWAHSETPESLLCVCLLLSGQIHKFSCIQWKKDRIQDSTNYYRILIQKLYRKHAVIIILIPIRTKLSQVYLIFIVISLLFRSIIFSRHVSQYPSTFSANTAKNRLKMYLWLFQPVQIIGF